MSEPICPSCGGDIPKWIRDQCDAVIEAVARYERLKDSVLEFLNDAKDNDQSGKAWAAKALERRVRWLLDEESK